MSEDETATEVKDEGKYMSCVNPMTLIGNERDQSLKYIEHLV